MISNWKCENAQIFHLVQLNGFTTLKCWPNDFYNFKFYSFNKTCLMRGFQKKLLYMYGQNTKCAPRCELECPMSQWGSTSRRRSGTPTPPSSSAAPASVSTSSASSPLTSASTSPSSGLRWAVIGGYPQYSSLIVGYSQYASLIGGYRQYSSLIGPGRGVGRHRERELERAGGRADQPRDRPRHDLAQDQLCQVAGKIFYKKYLI